MPVVDASALVEYLLWTEVGERFAARAHGMSTLAAPELIDLEVASALRRLESSGVVRPRRALDALDDLLLAPLVRWPTRVFLPRVWELRKTLTVYDAGYVALAEALDEPLLTADAPLARAHGHRARVILVT